jgi:hypothetical protein
VSAPRQPELREEFANDCRDLLAAVAVQASETLPIEKRIMLLHAVAALFPSTAPAHIEAKTTAYALASAEKHQLQLIRLIGEPTEEARPESART